MNFVQHRSSNDVLRPPAGATNDECRPLPITRVQFSDGIRGVVSFWRPTPDELQRLNDGQAVMLQALGDTHPPVALLVEGDPALPL